MEGVRSYETMSGRSGTETEIKIEIKEEFYAAMDGINSQETATGGVQPTIFPERNSVQVSEQFHEPILPSTQAMRRPLRCRLCASQGIDLVDMLGPSETDKNVLEKIEHCLPIVVTKTDPLPKQACRLCLANLELCYQFKRNVTEAERQLLALERLASSELEETGRNCETFQPYKEQRGPTENDNLEGPLTTTSDLETIDEESETIPEEVERRDSTVTSYVVSVSSKPCPELLFPDKTRCTNRPERKIKTRSSSRNVHQKAESSTNRLNSGQISAPQTTEQSTYDSLVFPETSSRLLEHKEMTLSSYSGREFKHKENLTLHDRIQISKRPYSCKWCAKTFKSKTGQNNHIRTHTGEGLHSCEYCNKKFSLRANRDYHHRLHTGERPYKCSICQKTFAWLSSVYEHASVHVQEKNYHCSVCTKSFKLLRARNRHMTNRHTGR